MLPDIYPLTIIKDRYSGTYSGGQWTAWNVDADCVPYGHQSCDITAHEFWLHNERPVGKGETIEGAIRDLYKKLDLEGRQ